MTTSSYWIEREALHYKQNLLKLGTYDRRLDRLYRQAYAAVEKEIADFYVKYADQNGLSMADAKERIAKFDVLAYQDRVAELLKKEHLSAKAKQELRLYNATMKINRLEMLKANIGLSLIETYQEEEDAYRECLDDVARAEYRRQSGILGETTHDMPKELLASTVEGSFHNATFSDRIWAHQDELRYRLESMLTNGLIQGKNPREYIPELRKQFNTSRYNASRLLRTEFARVQTDVQMKSFQEYGYDEYIFIANGTACPECAELNGQIFKVAEQQVGKNAPPVHPNCMCSTAAHTSRNLFQNDENRSIIAVGKTLSAAAMKYPVKDVNSNSHIKLVEGQNIEGVAFAGKGQKRQIRERFTLESKYGIPADEWQKMSGVGEVLQNGRRRKAEIHWYEAEGRRVMLKVKRYLDEG